MQRLLGWVLALAIVLRLAHHLPAQERLYVPGGLAGDDRSSMAVEGPASQSGWPDRGESVALPQPGRFDLTDRVLAITRGRVQLEGGYVFTTDRAAGVRTSEHTVPDLLLRVGLTDRVELRLGWPGYVATVDEGPSGRQTSDRTLAPSVGAMLDLWPQRGCVPQTAVLAAVPITLNGNPLTMESFQPLSQVLYAWFPTERWSFGGTTGFSPFDDSGDHFLQFQQSVNTDYLLTERLGVFVEWIVLVDHGSADDGSQHLLEGGFAFRCTERLQVTWRIGAGLNDRALDFLTGVRCAFRF